MSLLVQAQNTDVLSVFPQHDEIVTFLMKSAGPEAISRGALNLDWCVQRREYMRNYDLTQSSAEYWTHHHLLSGPCPAELILIGYLCVDTQLNVVLTSACWKQTVKVCISPFPHAYLHGEAVWMKFWTFVPSSDSGHFEMRLSDIVRLAENKTPPILNCPPTYNHITGVVRARSCVMKTASGTSHFFVELNILSPNCDAMGVHSEPESTRSCIVVCNEELLTYWPMLAEGVVVNFSSLALTYLPKHARKIILKSTHNSKVIPHPPNILQIPAAEKVTHKPAVVSINELSVGTAPSGLKLCPISYEGEISLRQNGVILLDGLFVVRLAKAGLSHLQPCLRVGARMKISWVVLVWNQKDAELFTTARTSIEVIVFSSEPTAITDYRMKAPSRLFPKPVRDVLFARFVESCMMSKFSMLTPGRANGSNDNGKCNLHHVLYGHKSNIGVVAILKQFSRRLSPDIWRHQSADALERFLDPAADISHPPKMPRLKDFERSYSFGAHTGHTSPQTTTEAIASIYKTKSASACHGCGKSVNSCNVHACHSWNVLLVGVLQSTGVYQRLLSLTDDSGRIIVVCKNGIPPEYVGALVALSSFVIATNAKGKFEALLVDLKDIRILMNGPNAAAQPHLVEGFAYSQKSSNPVRLAEYRISRALNKIEKVETVCWRHRKTVTEAIWTSHLLCILIKSDNPSKQYWEAYGQLVAIRRPRTLGWSPTTAAAASRDLHVRVCRHEAHRAPALDAGKLYSFSCSFANLQRLKSQMEQFSQSQSDSRYIGEFVLDYEELPHIGSVDPWVADVYRADFPLSRTRTVDLWNGWHDDDLRSHIERLNITWTCMTCNPLWTALCTERSAGESEQLVKLIGVVEGLIVTPEGTHLTISDNILRLVSLNITLKTPEICCGFVRGLNVAISAVQRHVREDMTISFEGSQATNILLTSTAESSLCKLCCRSSMISPWILNQTFPSSSFQCWANGERSTCRTGGCRSVRLRLRKLLRLELGQNVEREESTTAKDVCTCGQVQRALAATFLADDGSCQVEMSTTDTCDIFYLLDISSKQLSAIEKLQSWYEGGLISENVAKDAANFSYLQEEWKIVHELFLKRSFQPVKALVRTLSVPPCSASFAPSTVRFTRVAIERKDFWTCTLNALPTVRMLGVLTLDGVCRGRKDETSCCTRRSVSYFDYLDHIGFACARQGSQ